MSGLVVRAASGLVTVQDGGRPGRMHEGIPPGGALVPEGLARANAAVDNAWVEAALEILGAVTIAAVGTIRVGSDDGSARELRDGETWTVKCEGTRVRYLSVRGGIDVPEVLGGRGTLLAAAFGGHEGRALRRDDLLPAGAAPSRTRAPLPAPDLAAPLRILGGPDLDRLPAGVLERLLEATFRVDPRSDRVGTRLVGPALLRDGGDLGVSTPMVRGAIQLPPGGGPIVLGPDHPTTGGYPVVATVVRADLGRLGAIPAGGEVRFVTATGRYTGH